MNIQTYLITKMPQTPVGKYIASLIAHPVWVPIVYDEHFCDSYIVSQVVGRRNRWTGRIIRTVECDYWAK